jgi:hypothetical protein
MSLETLEAEEENLKSLVSSAAGTLEERYRSLSEAGVFRRSCTVLDGYLTLSGDPRLAREALKSAVFIAWHEHSEPAALTGIAGLPMDRAAASLALPSCGRDGLRGGVLAIGCVL